MKLRNKLFAGTGLTCAVFLLFTYLITFTAESIRYYLLAIVIFSLAIFSFTCFLLLIKRVERLNQEALRAKQNLSKCSIPHGNDELTSIAEQITALVDNIEDTQQNLAYRIKLRTQELQESNFRLQKELMEHKIFTKDLLVNKEHLTQLAHYDSLTSLPNRIFFNEMLNKAISHAKRHRSHFALLLIELDRFKLINDIIGRAKTDLVLKEIADRITTVLRSEDILARLDGDEFVLLLSNITQPKFASQVAEKILSLCSEPTHLDSHEFQITTSIGISIFPDNGKTLETLIINADKALYQAKQCGGGHFQYFTKEMDIEAHEHVQLESALRKAIHNNELVLYYQPKLTLKNDEIKGMEALIRWENPELGIISPSKFIPIAEATGLINEIGEWVLREACRTNKSWQNQGYQPINISVNLSPMQFQNQDIAKLVKTILAETHLDPKYLELEITESTVMNNISAAINRLNELKKTGVVISIDDFGVGYTSLSYLIKFPVSVIKIDQSFIKDLPANQDHAAIISAIITLAHNLGMTVVAEGVETSEQLQYLADHDCDMVQGYYLCRPLAGDKILALFANKTLNYSVMKQHTNIHEKD